MAKRNFQKKPLYRKVNTKARFVHHDSGPDYRHQRNTKAEKASTASRGKMVQGRQRGLDYTPLFQFLLSKVGQPFDQVHSEAVSRLDKEEPIFFMVAAKGAEPQALVCTGETSYFSGLFVDEDGILQLVDPDIKLSELWPRCACCTNTFNGTPFTNPYDDTRRALRSTT